MLRVSIVAAVCIYFCACAAAQSVVAPLPVGSAQVSSSNNLATASRPNSAPSAPPSHFTWEAGGGFTQPNGNASDQIHVGWNVRAGAGWNFSPRVGLLAEYEFNRYGWQSPILSGGARADGNVNIWGLTLEPIWRYKISRHFGGYGVAGAGFYRQVTSFANTVPGTDCNPFFGCYPATENAAPSASGNQVGANGGLGFTYKSNPSNRLAYYTEVRFLWLDTRPETAAFFPVSFGVRW